MISHRWIALVLLAAVGLPGSARAGWERQACEPTPVDLNCVTVVSPTEFWAGGDFGVIVHTTDGGNTYSVNKLGIFAAVEDIVFLDAMNGFAITGLGTYRTSNGGLTWTPGTLPAPARAAHFFDLSNGVGVGANAVYRTTDGGQNWTFQLLPEVVFDVEFIGTTGFLVGKKGMVQRSVDSGQTWVPVSISTSLDLLDVEMVGPNEAFAVSTSTTIFHTTDGGQNWTPIVVPEAKGLEAMEWTDAANVYACGWKTQILKSTDAAQSFTEQYLVPESGLLNEIAFADPDRGFAVGDRGMILQTTDGGKNWVQRSQGFGSQITEIDALDEEHVFASVFDNRLLVSCDGGRSFRTILPYPDDGLIFDINGFDFRTLQDGWIVGNVGGSSTGTILHTTDGGKTFAPSFQHANQEYLNVAALSDQVAVVSGFRIGFPFGMPLVLRTENGGQTWQDTSPSIQGADEWYDMQFVDSTTGFLCGDVVARTLDAGKTFQVIRQDDGFDYFAISFVDANVGWVGGAFGRLFFTSNGGQTWQQQNINSQARIVAIEAIDANRAWLCTADGELRKTTNGGATWQGEFITPGLPMTAMEMLDFETGWVGSGLFAGQNDPAGGLFKRVTPSLPCGFGSNASYSHFGQGFAAGDGKPPLVTALATPEVGENTALMLRNPAAGLQSGLLLLGMQPASIPAFGGTLLVQPLVSLLLPLPAGDTCLNLPIPNDTGLCGLSAYLQLLVPDPVSPQGAALSQGLELTLGS